MLCGSVQRLPQPGLSALERAGVIVICRPLFDRGQGTGDGGEVAENSPDVPPGPSDYTKRDTGTTV